MVPCIFIGYLDDFCGWKFWDPVAKRSFVQECSELDEQYFLLLKVNVEVPQLAPLLPLSPITEDHEPTFLSLDAQPNTHDAPKLPLQPAKQVRFSSPSPSVSPVPSSPPLCASVPMLPTPSCDPLDVILLDLCFQHSLMTLVLTWFYLVFHFDNHPWLLIPIPLMWYGAVLL